MLIAPPGPASAGVPAHPRRLLPFTPQPLPSAGSCGPHTVRALPARQLHHRVPCRLSSALFDVVSLRALGVGGCAAFWCPLELTILLACGGDEVAPGGVCSANYCGSPFLSRFHLRAGALLIECDCCFGTILYQAGSTFNYVCHGLSSLTTLSPIGRYIVRCTSCTHAPHARSTHTHTQGQGTSKVQHSTMY